MISILNQFNLIRKFQYQNVFKFAKNFLLQFEWAWQHPDTSRRLKHIPKKKSSQRVFDYCLTILSGMLQVGPWSRLPLTIRWLSEDFGGLYSNRVTPPIHMPITYGKATSDSSKRKKNNKSDQITNKDKLTKNLEKEEELSTCFLCNLSLNEADKIICLSQICKCTTHLICLSKEFEKNDLILPIEGSCPKCKLNLLWGDLIRKKIGCNMHLTEDDLIGESSESDSDS